MSARTRVGAAVAGIAVLAAVVVAAAAVVSAEEVPTRDVSRQVSEPRPGAPALVLDLGVRDDAEAQDLRRAAALHNRGSRARAGELFARHDSLEAKIGTAFAGWPGTLDRVEQLGALYPRSALAQLHLGLARFWAGEAGAAEAWREAREVEPDTLYAVRANDFLHPDFVPGVPVLVPSAAPPPGPPGLSGARRLELLQEAAADGPLAARLYLGVALQRLGRPVSARRVYEEAARAHPDDVEALVAAAVGSYTKERPAAAFSRLGPLSRRFPRSASVRFHLGLLLLWQRDVDAAKRQLRLAVAAEPQSRLAQEADRYLSALS